jgi:hypothetical protein
MTSLFRRGLTRALVLCQHATALMLGVIAAGFLSATFTGLQVYAQAGHASGYRLVGKAPVAFGAAVAVAGAVQTSTSTGPWQFFDNLSGGWVPVSCPDPIPGPAGPAGPAGPTGAAGPTGVAGATGPAGAVGPSGPAGPTGAPGAIGATGAAGAVGPAGPAGATGAKGATGSAGATGAAGAPGADGLPGPAGPTGPAGATGPAGPQGPAGSASKPYFDYQTMTLAPHTPAGMIALASPTDATTQIVVDGGTLYTDLGNVGVAKIYSGSNAACSADQHELMTVPISSMGGSFFLRPALPGAFVCLGVAASANSTGTFGVNGGLTWHTQGK